MNNTAEKISVESRPEYITEKNIRTIQEKIPLKGFEVGIGLETSNDPVRENAINKGFTFQEYKKAATLLRKHKVGVKTYVLLKPPFLTEKQSLQDCVKTAKDTAPFTDLLSLNPTNVQHHTVVEYLWETKPVSTAMALERRRNLPTEHTPHRCIHEMRRGRRGKQPRCPQLWRLRQKVTPCDPGILLDTGHRGVQRSLLRLPGTLARPTRPGESQFWLPRGFSTVEPMKPTVEENDIVVLIDENLRKILVDTNGKTDKIRGIGVIDPKSLIGKEYGAKLQIGSKQFWYWFPPFRTNCRDCIVKHRSSSQGMPRIS